jgi:hypothetical protein
MIKKNMLTGMDIQPIIKLLIIHLYSRRKQISDIHFRYQNNLCDLLDQQNLVLIILLQVIRCNIPF